LTARAIILCFKVNTDIFLRDPKYVSQNVKTNATKTEDDAERYRAVGLNGVFQRGRYGG